MRLLALRDGWAAPAYALFLALVPLTACTPARVSRIVDALNRDVTPAEAFVSAGQTMGIVKQMSFGWRSSEAQSHAKALKLTYRWCSAINALASEEECSNWEQRTSYLVLGAIDPESIRVEAGDEQLSVSFGCEDDKQCARPTPIGIPCRDGLACERVRDNLAKLVRFAHGGAIEEAST